VAWRLYAGTALGLIAVDGAAVRASISPTTRMEGVRAVGAPVDGAGEDAYADGRALLGASNVTEALAKFRQALAESQHSLDALNAIAVSYDRLGRSDIARTYYEQGLAIDPASPLLLNYLGYSLYLQKDYANAIAPLRTAAAAQDADIAKTARQTLALIAAALVTARSSVIDTVPTEYIERISEGEQRLVLDRPATTDRFADAEISVEVASNKRLERTDRDSPTRTTPHPDVDTAQRDNSITAAMLAAKKLPSPSALPRTASFEQPIQANTFTDIRQVGLSGHGRLANTQRHRTDDSSTSPDADQHGRSPPADVSTIDFDSILDAFAQQMRFFRQDLVTDVRI